MNLSLCERLVVVSRQKGENRMGLCPLLDIEYVVGLVLEPVNVDWNM